MDRNVIVMFVIQYILLAVVFAIMMIFRKKDQKDRQIHLVKSLMESMKDEVEERYRGMRNSVEVMEDSIKENEIHIEAKLKQANGFLTNLDKQADNLQKMNDHMQQYHRIMKEMDGVTAKAELRMSNIEHEIAEFDDIADRIEGFQQKITDVEHSLTEKADLLQEQLDGIRKERLVSFSDEAEKAAVELEESIQQLKSSVMADVENEIDSKIANALADIAVPHIPQVSTPDIGVVDNEEDPRQELAAETAPEETAAAEADQVEVESLAVEPAVDAVEEAETICEPEVVADPDPEPASEPDFALETESVSKPEMIPAAEPAESEPEPASEPEPESEPVDFEEDEIFFDADEDDDIPIDEEELEEIEAKLSKREMVERYAGEGLDSARIAELTGIPRGEVELILELIDFTRE